MTLGRVGKRGSTGGDLGFGRDLEGPRRERRPPELLRP